MGVRGLQSFLQVCCPDAYYSVDIRRLADTYRTVTGKQPILVVDALGMIRQIYSGLNWMLGGQWKELVEVVKNFVSRFNAIGVKLVFFFDGLTENLKRQIWINRRTRSIQDVYMFFDQLYAGQNVRDVDYNSLAMPPSMALFFRYILMIECNCEVRCTLEECDREIARYMLENDGFAVLAQDTDFVIYNIPGHYLSLEHLDLASLRTMAYDRNQFAKKIRLAMDELPLLASLLGNDVVIAESLEQFHRSLHHTSSRCAVIWKVVSFVQRFCSGRPIHARLQDISNEVFHTPQKASLLKQSIESYNLQSAPRAKKVGKCSNNWNAILSEAINRHKSSTNITFVYGTIMGDPYESSTALEDFRCKNIPMSALVWRPLRQKIYGILLSEKMESHSGFGIKEYTVYSSTSLNNVDTVAVIFPAVEHPGLLQLWTSDSSAIKDMQWKLFCNSVSDKLDAEALRQLPPHLVVPTVIVFYLKHVHLPKFLKSWEAEAILAQAASVSEVSVESIRRIQDPTKPQARFLHLGTIFMRGVSAVLFLLGACGYPVPLEEAQPWKFYDGKIFHETYKSAEIGMRDRELCLSKRVVSNFLLMKRICADL